MTARETPCQKCKAERDRLRERVRELEAAQTLKGALPWRTGTKVGRTIYDAHGALIGTLDTPELAALAVKAVNGQAANAAIAWAARLVNWPEALRAERDIPFDVLKLGTVVLSHLNQEQAAPISGALVNGARPPAVYVCDDDCESPRCPARKPR